MAKFDPAKLATGLGLWFAQQRAGERDRQQYEQQRQGQQFRQALQAAEFLHQTQREQADQPLRQMEAVSRIPGFVPTPEFSAGMYEQLQRPQPQLDYRALAGSVPKGREWDPWRVALEGAGGGPQAAPVPFQEGVGNLARGQAPGGAPGAPGRSTLPPPRFRSRSETEQYGQLIDAYTKRAADPDAEPDETVRSSYGQTAALLQDAFEKGLPLKDVLAQNPGLGAAGYGGLKPKTVNKDRKARVTRGVQSIQADVAKRLASPEVRAAWTKFITENPIPTDYETDPGLDYADAWQTRASSFRDSVAGPAETAAEQRQATQILVQRNRALADLQKPGLKAEDYIRASKELTRLNQHPLIEKYYGEMGLTVPEDMDASRRLITRRIPLETQAKGPGLTDVERSARGPGAGLLDTGQAPPVETQYEEREGEETEAEVNSRIWRAAAARAEDPKEKTRLLQGAFGQLMNTVRSQQFGAMDEGARAGILAALNDVADDLGLPALPKQIEVGLTPREQALNEDRKFRRSMTLRKQRFSEGQQKERLDLLQQANLRAQQKWERERAKSPQVKWTDQDKALFTEAKARRDSALKEVQRLQRMAELPDYRRGEQYKGAAYEAKVAKAKDALDTAQMAVDEFIGPMPLPGTRGVDVQSEPKMVIEGPGGAPAKQSSGGVSIQDKIKAAAAGANREATIRALMNKYGYTRANAIKKMDALKVK